MDTALSGTLVALGLGGGFLSGLLGLGGAIFMIPLLLYVPPLLGVGHLDMKAVAAISMVQVLAASLSGLLVHNKNRFVKVSPDRHRCHHCRDRHEDVVPGDNRALTERQAANYLTNIRGTCPGTRKQGN